MGSMKKLVKNLINSGLSIIPITKGTKIPCISFLTDKKITWKRYQNELLSDKGVDFLFKEDRDIACIGGVVSKGLICIDIDTKNDIGEISIATKLKNLINEQNKELFSKLVIAETPSGGFHLYYRSGIKIGNKKLAKRNTTEEEKKINPNQNTKDLIETKSEGGYFLIPPSTGYKYLRKNLTHVQNLSNVEHEIIINSAKMLHEIEVTKPKIVSFSEKIFNNESEDFWSKENNKYNSNDIYHLLKKHGWEYANHSNDIMRIRRPGKKQGSHSGTIGFCDKAFYCFTSSTKFNSDRPYNYIQIKCLLEFNNNWREYFKFLNNK
jgi:hypothetical protein